MIKGIIYDLDGVITDTAIYHYQAWKWLAAVFDHDLTPQQNEALKGVGRRESLEHILALADKKLSEEDKLKWMAEKNERYLQLVQGMGPKDIFEGFMQAHQAFQQQGWRTSIGSSSKNAGTILAKLGLADVFDAISDGTMSERSKPEPDIFLNAADLLGLPPVNCVVFEDSQAGIDGALRAGMIAISFGPEELDRAHLHVQDWTQFKIDNLKDLTP